MPPTDSSVSLTRWRSAGVLLGVAIGFALITTIISQSPCPSGQRATSGTIPCNATTPCPSGSTCNTATGICCTSCSMQSAARRAARFAARQARRAAFLARRQNNQQNRGFFDYVGQLNFDTSSHVEGEEVIGGNTTEWPDITFDNMPEGAQGVVMQLHPLDGEEREE